MTSTAIVGGKRARETHRREPNSKECEKVYGQAQMLVREATQEQMVFISDEDLITHLLNSRIPWPGSLPRFCERAIFLRTKIVPQLRKNGVIETGEDGGVIFMGSLKKSRENEKDRQQDLDGDAVVRPVFIIAPDLTSPIAGLSWQEVSERGLLIT